MPDQSPSLEALRKIIEASDSSRVTKADFDALAKQLIDLFKKIQEKNGAEVQAMKQALDTAMSRLETNNGQSVSSIKSELMTTLNSHMKSMLATHEAKMAQVDEKMDSVMDGKDADEEMMVEKVKSDLTPVLTADVTDKVEKDLPKLGSAIRDGLELLPEEEKLDKSAIRGLMEEIASIKKELSSRAGYGGGRASHGMKVYDLSSQTNGSTKIFSVPKSVTGFLVGSDFPTVLIENNGYTANKTRTQITLTPTNAPSSGSQLAYIYSEFFNT